MFRIAKIDPIHDVLSRVSLLCFAGEVSKYADLLNIATILQRILYILQFVEERVVIELACNRFLMKPYVTIAFIELKMIEVEEEFDRMRIDTERRTRLSKKVVSIAQEIKELLVVMKRHYSAHYF